MNRMKGEREKKKGMKTGWVNLQRQRRCVSRTHRLQVNHKRCNLQIINLEEYRPKA